MINRPRPTYLMKMRKDEPHEKDVEELKRIYKCGGVKEFEPDVMIRMGDIKIEQYFHTDPYTHEKVKWTYVGNYWWCRRRRFSVKDTGPNEYHRVREEKYEFARIMAVVNANGIEQLDGLWDARRHVFREPPERVLILGKKAVIVGHNEWEVFVAPLIGGDPGSPIPIKKLSDLEFEFVEDYNKYKKIFGMIEKHVAKIS
jgi:hypothetical protein